MNLVSKVLEINTGIKRIFKDMMILSLKFGGIEILAISSFVPDSCSSLYFSIRL